MAIITITINQRSHTLDVDADTPLLWVLRDELGLTGTKYGCGVGTCGACTVLQGNAAVRSCQLPASAAAGKAFVTIEGLSSDGSHACQQAWVAEDVSQCGYCQAGMLMTAAALLNRTPRPTAAELAAAMDRHICRCGTYPRIRKAIERLTEERP